MTKPPTSPMDLDLDLDLDSFLHHTTASSSDDDSPSTAPQRTVDDILNDSASSSSDDTDHESTTSSFRSPYVSVPGDAVSLETLNSKRLESSSEHKSASQSRYNYNQNLIHRFKSDELLFYGSSKSKPPVAAAAMGNRSSLFGSSVRTTAKPGAALAAAAAAARTVPTPFAAAMKSRRARSGVLKRKGSDGGELLGLGFVNDVNDAVSVRSADGEVRSEGGDDRMGEFHSAVSSDRLSENASEKSEKDAVESVKGIDGREIGGLVDNERGSSTADEEALVITNSIVEMSNLDHGDDQILNRDDLKDAESSSTSHASWDIVEFVEPSVPDDNVGNSLEDDKGEVMGINESQEVQKIGDDSKSEEPGVVRRDNMSSISDDVNELVEDRLAQLESERALKRTEKKSLPPKKPLELAEELEKKQASTGLHWEEGAVAQPMKLEGVRRGSIALGYFDIDGNNTITRMISSQAFRRDHGSALSLAVHQNHIALGMTKGVVFVVPSKYSFYHPDSMDTKMSMLGLHSDRSQAPVTSLCFNIQGDWLLAGYGDGHVTLWDVQRSTAVKVFVGEHSAPVVYVFFVGQSRAVTGDSKGRVVLHTISQMLFGRYTFESKCFFDGITTSIVLWASPLLPDGFGAAASSVTSQGGFPGSTVGSGGKASGAIGGSWKLFGEGSSVSEEAVASFTDHQRVLAMRLIPSMTPFPDHLSKPYGVREGSMPYTAWKSTIQSHDSSAASVHEEISEKLSLLAIAWDRKVQVAKLSKSGLDVQTEWTLDSAALGLTWLDHQMLVVLTLTGQLCLFARDGVMIHKTSYAVAGSGGDDLISYHTHFTNKFGNPEKAYHNSVAIRGASVYILGPTQLLVSRLLPWKERIQVLRKAGDWMGALNMALTLYDGQAHGVIDLPRGLDAIQDAIMSYMVELIISYVDEVFSYISVACFNQIDEEVDGSEHTNGSILTEIKEQFTRVGGVAVEFCVHIKRTDLLFDDIFSKFFGVQQKDTFLELLEPYILKDMLGFLPPEIMQALVEHYNSKGWLQRVEQCVLHMDISSLDFNQVVRLCQEHGLYGALIYLFNKGLNDFRTPLEEFLSVLRNRGRDEATALGYRMLVYLKYCFLGLAFPPGHGTLPSERVPSLQIELLQFLLEDSGGPRMRSDTSIISSGTYLKLYYLLELDTEATLDVLRFAFTGAADLNPEKSLNDSSEANEIAKKKESISQSQRLLLQSIVDALVLILDTEISRTVRSAGIEETGSGGWPTKKDIGFLIEFIASFVASERAAISKSVLSQILEYLTLEDYVVQSDSIPPSVSKNRKEKQVLALLNVVPETDWNASYVLHLCERTQFHQVCGLIHSIRHQYLAALDSYMKDEDEPVHAFTFINSILLQLSEAESVDFRECTFFLVIDRFVEDIGQILSVLQSHPESLFLYLKTMVEVHLNGTLDFNFLKKDDTVDYSFQRSIRGHQMELQTYFERVADFPKLVRSTPIEVTDDITELYLKLLCQFEPPSVLKFLETFDSYRVEPCLRLCQEYGIIDAAAFLFERVGDVGNALQLTLSGINDKFLALDAVIKSMVSDMGVIDHPMEQVDTALKLSEVKDIINILHSCVELCQRNTPRLEPEEAESLWFLLLDLFSKPLVLSEGKQKGATSSESSASKDSEGTSFSNWKIHKTHTGGPILKRLFAHFIKEIVEGMIGYVRPLSIMSKLLSDSSNQEFGDFKLTILGILGRYGFERKILDTAKSLIENDTFYTMSLLKKGASHGYAPRSLLCCICNCPFNKNSSASGIRVFSCGHSAHLQCELQENDAFGQSTSNGCPICVPKKRIQSSRGKTMELGFLWKSTPRSQKAKGTTAQPSHETDAFEISRGLSQISRFDLLSNLEKNQKLIHIESLPPLRLAPPPVYNEKIKSTIHLSVGESRRGLGEDGIGNRNKQAKDVKGKGSSVKFQLSSRIFGKEKTRLR
ncbi:Vacuolar protein sorting-associated protein 8-like protein [Drosera capensis]